jgi:NADH dehydrogenase [ubiquinone] 1 alpha subcomplex assembly factor 5
VSQIVHLIGWKPHESQQKPLARGSAKRSLKEIGAA